MREAVEAIKRAGSIVITAHIRPDGDAVGSTLAILRGLTAIGKECRAISPSHIPYGFTFMLEDEEEVLRYQPAR